MVPKKIILLYIVIVLLDVLVLSIPDFQQFRFITKPLIVGSLIIYFLKRRFTKTKVKNLLLFALLFSWIGDVVLMFEDETPYAFIFGLVAFLIAHIFYVLIFNMQRNKTNPKFRSIFFVLIYTTVIFTILKDSLNEMLIPVVLYMIVILAMLILALLRKNINTTYVLVVIGAILFVISDSILATDKFRYSITFAPQLIIITYAAAQFFIFYGLLKSFKRPNQPEPTI